MGVRITVFFFCILHFLRAVFPSNPDIYDSQMPQIKYLPTKCEKKAIRQIVHPISVRLEWQVANTKLSRKHYFWTSEFKTLA